MKKDKIEYSFFVPADADEVADLMRRNHFWMGKYDPDLNGERFLRYQAEKGFCFGVVGKAAGQSVAYVGAYRLGSQRATGRHQIIMSGLLIDAAYRSAVFTLSDLFLMILTRVREEGYKELIAEVGQNNLLSLYMMKKTGFVVLDNTPTVYGEIVLRNYLPAILDCVWSREMPDAASLLRGIQKINKKNLLETVPFLDPFHVATTWSVGREKYEFDIDIRTGEVSGVRRSGSFSLRPGRNGSYDLVRERSGRDHAISLLFLKNEEVILTEQDPDEVNVPEEADAMQIGDLSTPYTFLLSLRTPPAGVRGRTERGRIFDFREETGFSYFPSAAKPEFFGMWPCIAPPYTEGLMEANRSKHLLTRRIDADKVRCVEEREDGRCVEQVYTQKEETLQVTTKVSGKTDRPLIHFGIMDPDCQILVRYADGSEKTYLADEHDGVFAELIFEDFRHDGCMDQDVKDVILKFEESQYRLSPLHPCRLLVNQNYLAFFPEDPDPSDGILMEMQIHRDSA